MLKVLWDLSGSSSRIFCRKMASKSSKSLSSVNITFLGTASAQPSSTRNHSALALRLDSSVWLFDCGEATQHQLQKSTVKSGKIEKIFITHTHGDHIFGLVPLMTSILNGAGGIADGEDPRAEIDFSSMEPLEIYGPFGTRAYVRTGLKYSHSNLGRPYVVHELRLPSDEPSEDFLPLDRAELAFGRNLTVGSESNTWDNIFEDPTFTVSAAPIMHSVPCIGYVVHEKPVPGKIDPKDCIPHLKRLNMPLSTMRVLQEGTDVTLPDGTVLRAPPRRKGRKLTILGDTYDPSPIIPLAQDSDVLVHEATNAYLPIVDPSTKENDNEQIVEERAKSRGHSTPQVAGKFAKAINAQMLILNHFSARYAGNDDVNEEARKMMEAIRDLAYDEFGKPVVCSRDLMSMDISLKS